MRANNFLFGVIITLSILMCCKCFQYAANHRAVDNAVGGEVFTIVLPVALIHQKLKSVEQKQASRTKQRSLN